MGKIIAILISPLAIFLFAMMSGFIIYTLPLLSLGMAAGYLSNPKRRDPNLNILGHAALGILFGIFIASLTAPCLAAVEIVRALGLSLPVNALWGDDAWVPMISGLCGFLIGASLTLLNLQWRFKQLRQLEDLPSSTARSAAIGLAEFRGVARTGPETESGKPILSLRRNKRTGDVNQTLRSFYLEDETGRILVEPAGAVFRMHWSDIIQGRTNEIALTGHGTGHWDIRELKDGDPVYLIGSVQIKKMDGGPDAISVRPLRETLQTPRLIAALFHKKNSKPDRTEKRELNHIFFLSDSPEMPARKRILSGLRQALMVGCLWAGLSLILMTISFPHLKGYPWINALVELFTN